MNTAMVLFGQNGVANVTLAEIAKTAGLSLSSIYQYFPDKNAIVLALAAQHRGKLHDFISRYSSEIHDLEGVSLYSRGLIKFYRKYLRANRGWIAIVDHVNNSSEFREAAFQQRKVYAQIVRDKLKHLVAAEQHEALEEVCYWWGYTVHSSLSLELLKSEKSLDTEEFICDTLTQRLEALMA